MSPGKADAPRRRGSIAAEAAAPRAKVGKGTRWLLLAILGLGLAVRLLHFWAIAGTALPKFHTVVESDMRTYWNWAQQILTGDVLGAYHHYISYLQQIAPLETWHRWWGGKEIFRTAPLYPYWVAALLALSRGSLNVVLLAQLLVGALQPLVLFGLARRLFDYRVGLVAAALTALYGPFIFYQGILLRDWLPPLLEPLALLALLKARDSGRGRAWLLAGAALGLALLAKETALLFLLAVGPWLLWERWPGWQQAVRAGAYLLTGLVLCLSPLLVRNALVGAPLFSLSNRAAQSFIAANAADATPVGWMPIPETMKRVLERSNGKLLPTIRETLRTYQGDYGGFLRKQAIKLRALADSHEVPGEGVAFLYGPEVSPVLRFMLRYGFIFPLGVAGLLLSLPTWRRQRMLYLYLPAVVGGQVYGAVMDRYRLILVPVVLLYAAVAVVWILDAFRQRRIVLALGGLCLALGVAVVQHVWIPPFRSEVYDKRYGRRLQYYVIAAQVYAAEGQLERALAELGRFREKVGRGPNVARLSFEASLLEGDYRAQWAKQLLDEGRRDEARQQVEQAEAAYASHRNLSYPSYNLGVLYLKLDEPAKARPFLERFLELDPQGPRASQVRRLLAGLKGAS